MARKPLYSFLCDQRRASPLVRSDLTGKTILVIGANTGLGFEASKHFATMQPERLILACRNPEKGAAAVAKIEQETGYRKTELWILDLSKFSSVRDFADKFETDGGRLDIVVANAAIANFEYEATTDGWESTIEVNHLSTALVSILLLPYLVKTAREFSTTPRIVVVSSDMHYWATIEPKVVQSVNMLKVMGSKEYCTPSVMGRRYQLSKLLNVFFVRGLNFHLKSPALIVNGVNPGYCYSELRRGWTGVRAFIGSLMERILAFTAEEGSRQLVWAALGGAENEEQLRGAYVSKSQVCEASDFVVGDEGHEIEERLWAETIGILTDVDPRVKAIAEEYL